MLLYCKETLQVRWSWQLRASDSLQKYWLWPVQALHAIDGLSAAEAVSFMYLVVQQLEMPLSVSCGGQRNHP